MRERKDYGRKVISGCDLMNLSDFGQFRMWRLRRWGRGGLFLLWWIQIRPVLRLMKRTISKSIYLRPCEVVSHNPPSLFSFSLSPYSLSPLPLFFHLPSLPLTFSPSSFLLPFLSSSLLTPIALFICLALFLRLRHTFSSHFRFILSLSLSYFSLFSPLQFEIRMRLLCVKEAKGGKRRRGKDKGCECGCSVIGRERYQRCTKWECGRNNLTQIKTFSLSLFSFPLSLSFSLCKVKRRSESLSSDSLLQSLPSIRHKRRHLERERKNEREMREKRYSEKRECMRGGEKGSVYERKNRRVSERERKREERPPRHRHLLYRPHFLSIFCAI